VISEQCCELVASCRWDLHSFTEKSTATADIFLYGLKLSHDKLSRDFHCLLGMAWLAFLGCAPALPCYNSFRALCICLYSHHGWRSCTKQAFS